MAGRQKPTPERLNRASLLTQAISSTSRLKCATVASQTGGWDSFSSVASAAGFHRLAAGSGAPGIGRAWGSSGGPSSDRKANRSASSAWSSRFSIPSGVIDSLPARVDFTWLRGTV